MEEKDYVIVWAAPIIEKPEFRLYYDERGNVICYSCEKFLGNYIVIDAMTFAICDSNVRVVDGKISTATRGAVVSKLMPNTEGVTCAAEDITIIVNKDYADKTINWKHIIYDL
jgi:hypothetical protein